MAVAAVFIENECAVKGDRMKVREEEDRVNIIVVIFVDREMFRDLTGIFTSVFRWTALCTVKPR